MQGGGGDSSKTITPRFASREKEVCTGGVGKEVGKDLGNKPVRGVGWAGKGKDMERGNQDNCRQVSALWAAWPDHVRRRPILNPGCM